MDELKKLAPAIEQVLAEHVDLYLRDPEKAHRWDPAAIGIPGGPISALLLRTRGRKSGEERRVTLQYFEAEGHYIVVASKGGVAEHPAWYLNIVENPAVEIQIAKLRYRATARTAQGEERTKLWKIVSEEQPQYLKYQLRTSREIPVVVFDLVY